MRTRVKAALITVGGGVPAFFLTPVLFPLNPAIPAPDPSLILYFLSLSVVESLFFGLGLAFLALSLPTMRRVASVAGVSPWPAYLSIGYLTASWWPHLGMHGVAGLDAELLIVVDYAFHLPYIVSAGVVAYFFVEVIRATATASESAPTGQISQARRLAA